MPNPEKLKCLLQKDLRKLWGRELAHSPRVSRAMLLVIS